MKRRVLIGLLACGMLLTAAGCKKEVREKINTFGNTDHGVYVYADNTVQDVTFYDWDQDKYDTEELKGFLQEEIDAYNAANPFTKPEPETNAKGEVVSESKVTVPIEIVDLKADGDSLSIQLLYASTRDYLNYMETSVSERGGNTLQAGKLINADASVQNAAFVDCDGEAVDMAKLLSSKKADEYRYVICNFECVLYGDGDVYAYSGGSYNDKANCITVPAGQTVIVLFH